MLAKQTIGRRQGNSHTHARARCVHVHVCTFVCVCVVSVSVSVWRLSFLDFGAAWGEIQPAVGGVLLLQGARLAARQPLRERQDG